MEDETVPVWFITGCSTGFGRELAKLILARGWKAVITARQVDQVTDLAEGYSNAALVLSLDVIKKEQVAAAIAQARETFGRIDVLVNNAGYGYFTSIEEGKRIKSGPSLTPIFSGWSI